MAYHAATSVVVEQTTSMLLRVAPAVLLVAAIAGQRDSTPTSPPQPTGADSPPPYRLVWSDEFERDGAPDDTRWNYDVGGHGWGNDELQFYTADRRENARVEGGHLVIEARREPWHGRSYTSARLTSKGKGDWTYGRIEVRAQLPAGRGSWPAIWTLGTKTPYRWPDDGEIDVMEHVGFDAGVVHAAVHTRTYNHVRGTHRTASMPVPDASTGFHVYATDWSPDRIETSIDGRVFFTFPREPGGGHAAWPFDGPQHLLLNVAVGGKWGGRQGVDDATLPYRFVIDYVRVYQRVR
jgi:beta-glucanase (GH16 family)